MTDQVLRPDGTGFYLAGGELTGPGAEVGAVDLSVSARLLDGLDVTLASQTDGVLPLQTRPLTLNSLPSTIRVQLHTDAPEGDWQLSLHFHNAAGPGLTWHATLPAEAFTTGWDAPLADLLTIDRPSPTIAVVHHPDDEYYELLVDGQQAGLLVYHVIGEHLSITHTVIEPAYRGQGLSWTLVAGALDDIRTKYPTISNYCPVVTRFVEKHPSYGDLVRST